MVWKIKKIYINEWYMLDIISLHNMNSLKRISGFIMNKEGVDGPVFQQEEMEHIKITI